MSDLNRLVDVMRLLDDMATWVLQNQVLASGFQAEKAENLLEEYKNLRKL